MTDIATELRIIARDTRSMSTPDRSVICEAANLVEQLVATQEKLIESQAQRIALNERLLSVIGARQKQLFTPISGNFVYKGWVTSPWREFKTR